MKIPLNYCLRYMAGWGMALLFILCTPIIALFFIIGTLLMAVNGSLFSNLTTEVDENNP